MTKQQKAIAFALMAIFFWSTVAAAFKISLRSFSTSQLVFLSSLTSALALLLMIVVSQQKRALFKLSLGKASLLRSALLGLVSPFCYYLILFEAYNRLPGQVAQPINFIWPIILSFMSVIFLKQKISWYSFLALFISFIGVVILATQGHIKTLEFPEPLGIILCLSSTIIWSSYWIINVVDKRDALLKLFLNFLFSLVYISIFLWWRQEFDFSINLNLLGPVYVGLFEMGISFYFWMRALELTDDTSKVSNLLYLAPPISLLILNLVAGEHIYFTSVIGLVFILIGVIIQRNLTGKQKAKE